jgi:hypothetical protein
MKTKIVITNIVDFVLGIVMFSLALAELFVFGITSDTDKLTMSFLSLALGMRYTCDSIDKIYIKEENNNGK